MGGPARRGKHAAVPGARRRESDGPRTPELYPRRYSAGHSVVLRIRSALPHEALGLGVFVGGAAFRAWTPGELQDRGAKEFAGTFGGGHVAAGRARRYREERRPESEEDVGEGGRDRRMRLP